MMSTGATRAEVEEAIVRTLCRSCVKPPQERDEHEWVVYREAGAILDALLSERVGPCPENCVDGWIHPTGEYDWSEVGFDPCPAGCDQGQVRLPPYAVLTADGHLFNFGDFSLHSGGRSNFKIDCDHLTDDDLESLAALAASRYRWSYALGIGTGGSRFARILAQYNTKNEDDPRMIVDDVLTTGASMEQERERVKGESFGLVIFTRSKPAEWIRPLFALRAPQAEEAPR